MKDDIVSMLVKGELTGRPVNAYVNDDYTEAYIRVTRRYLEGEWVKTLELGNVNVDEAHQRKGHFKALLMLLEELASEYGRIVFIESVLNDMLVKKLPSYGYKWISGSYPPIFIK